MISSGIPLNIQQVTCTFLGIHTNFQASVYMGEGCITKVYHSIENAVASTIKAALYGKVRYNTVKYITAILYSDWLYFQWHGINI